MVSDIISIFPHGASREIHRDGYAISVLADIKEWLINKNIISSSDILLSYRDVKEWFKSGDETYLSSFYISYCRCEKVENKTIVLKAITTLNPEKSLLDWYRRRKILRENFVPVSNWYWCNNGIIIEDYYPNDWSFYNLDTLKSIANVLDRLGFITTDFLRDIKCDEYGNLFYIDFGFDLGEPSFKETNTSKQTLNNKIGTLSNNEK